MAKVFGLLVLVVVPCTVPLAAQGIDPTRWEEVGYRNAEDGTRLSARLAMPAGEGPHPVLVALTLAGTDELVSRFVDEGWGVLLPERRGFVEVEPLLRASYADLAGDVRAALDHLADRRDVDPDRLALLGQADDAPPALLALAERSGAVPLVLLAPPVLRGVETFRREQRSLAERDGAEMDELEALDRYVADIAEIALDGGSPYLREARLVALRASSSVALPRNAAFPADERQAHFFASPLWHDRLAFEPEDVFARLRSPVLVLTGVDDPRATSDAYLDGLLRALDSASTPDASSCIVEGRTRHTFSPSALDVIVRWLRDGTRALLGCLDQAQFRS